MSRSTPWFLLVLCLAGLLLARESRQPAGALAGVDRAFLDWLSANAPAAPANLAAGGVTLVEIDDAVAATRGRLPLTPLEYAAFLQAVSRYEPAVVAVEPTLEWPQQASGTGQILLDQALTIPKLLLSARLGSSAADARDPASVPALDAVEGSRSALAEFPEIVAAPDARLLPLAAACGVANLPGPEGAPIRDLPLVFRCRERVLPGFALETLALALRLAPSEVSVVLGSHVQLGERLRLPIDRAGRALLDARAFERINRLALDDLPLLAAGQAGPAVRVAAERMRGGTVLLGRTDKAARTLRLPGGRAASPAEVFAWAAVSLPRVPPVRRGGAGWDGGIGLIFAGLGWWLLRRRRASALALALAALAVYALAALSAFEYAGVWLPCALPAGLALLIGALAWLLPEAEGSRPARKEPGKSQGF